MRPLPPSPRAPCPPTVLKLRAPGSGYGVVRDFFGHGIGQHFHEQPMVSHVGEPNTGALLEPGMVITVEPMLNLGTPSVRVLNDQWTVESADGSLSAQWEHMVLVTRNGYEVLTLRPGEDQRRRVADGGGG